MLPIHDYYEKLAPTYDRERFGNSYGRYVDAMERRVLRDQHRGHEPEAVVEIACSEFAAGIGTGGEKPAMNIIDATSGKPSAGSTPHGAMDSGMSEMGELFKHRNH